MIVSSVISRPVQVSVLSNTYAVNIAALKAIDVSEIAGNTQISVAGYYAPGDGGGGIFYYDAGSSATDNGGTIIAPTVGSGRWKRIYSDTINVKHFGAKGDGVTNDNDAFRLASNLISTAGGGTLLIPPGTYIVGKQDFAGASNLSYSYQSHDVINIVGCTRPVTIYAAGATIRNADGIKFGAFDPETGLSKPGGSSSSNFKAHAPVHIRVESCSGGVAIIGPLDLDGNDAGAVKGGTSPTGDGYQVSGYGIYSYNDVIGLTIDFVHAHNHVVDGIVIREENTTFYDKPPMRARVRDSSFHYNGRQGCSIVGGMDISFLRCSFSYTGRGTVTDNTPGCGVDIEPNATRYVSDVAFDSCDFIDNKNANITIPNGDSVKCVRFSGCRFWSSVSVNAWVASPYVSFYNCTFLGTSVGLTYASSGNHDQARTRFISCLFTDEPYPGRPTSGSNLVPFTTIGRGTLIDSCEFSNIFSLWDRIIYSYNNDEHEYRDCRFTNYKVSLASSLAGYVRGAVFTGTNRIVDASGGVGHSYLVNNTSTVVSGSLLLESPTIHWNSLSGPTGDIGRFYGQRSAAKLEIGTSSLVSCQIVYSSSESPEGVWSVGSLLINPSAAVGGVSYRQCTTAGAIGSAWAGSTSYSVGAVRSNDGGKYYRCAVAGTSAASGGPTGTTSPVADGTAIWDYVANATAVFTAHFL